MTLLSATLVAPMGCNTGSGALTGGAVGAGIGALVFRRNPVAGALAGAAIGAATGAIIGRINEQQREKLKAESPQTWETIQHNDAAVAAAKNPPPPAAPAAGGDTNNTAGAGNAPAPPADKPTPLMVDDIKAMASSGIKEDVICDEITQSQAVYTQQDIDAVQQTSPPIDPQVVTCMKQHMNS